MPLVPFVAFGLLVELLEELFEPFGCVPDAPPFIDPPVLPLGVVDAGVPLFCAFGSVFDVPFGFVAELEPFGGPVMVPVFVVPLSMVPLLDVPVFIEFPLCWAHVPPPMSAGRTRLGGATFCAA